MKDSEMRRFLGLTWMGWINVFLQFTGFRLVRHVETDGPVPPIGTVSKKEIRFVGLPWRWGWTLPRFFK